MCRTLSGRSSFEIPVGSEPPSLIHSGSDKSNVVCEFDAKDGAGVPIVIDDGMVDELANDEISSILH
jgi:hypothetical protein